MTAHGRKRKRRIGIAVWPALCGALAAHGQDTPRGSDIFDGVCAQCHGPDARGGPLGPSIVERVATTDEAELAAFLRVGRPERGMPPALVSDSEMETLVGYLKSLGEAAGVVAASGVTPSSSTAASAADDVRVERRRGARIDTLPSVTDAVLASPDDADWLWFGRVRDGRAYSPLAEIGKANVRALRLAWSRGLPAGDVEPRAIVYAGVMFVVMPDSGIAALDAATGDPIWQRGADESGLAAAPGANVELELHGETLFVQAGRATVALDARTGALRSEALPPSLPAADDVEEPAVLATGGGLVFRGGRDRRYRALDAESGDVLWETILGSPVTSSGMSFAVDGRQHIAVIVGTAGSGSQGTPGDDADAVPGAIYVFALSGNRVPDTGRKQ